MKKKNWAVPSSGNEKEQTGQVLWTWTFLVLLNLVGWTDRQAVAVVAWRGHDKHGSGCGHSFPTCSVVVVGTGSLSPVSSL